MKTFVLILVNVYMVHGYGYGECFPEMVNKTYLHLPPQNGPPVLNTPSNEECFQHCVEDVKCIAYTFKYDSLECSLFHLMPDTELPEKEIPCQSHCFTRYLALPHWCKDISNDTPIYHSLLTSFGALCKNQLKMQMEFNRTKEFIDKMETNHKDKIGTLENRINDLEQYKDKMEDKIDAMVKDRMRKLEDKIDAMDKDKIRTLEKRMNSMEQVKGTVGNLDRKINDLELGKDKIRKLEDKIDSMDKVETIRYIYGVYTGMTRNGIPNGMGTMKFAYGDMYVGNWENNEKHGYGVYLSSDGTMYSGQWVNGIGTGIGYLNLPSGSMYVGQFKDDKRNGNGQFFRSDGGRYAGGFKDGNKHGSGVIMRSDGTMRNGQWFNDHGPYPFPLY